MFTQVLVVLLLRDLLAKANIHPITSCLTFNGGSTKTILCRIIHFLYCVKFVEKNTSKLQLVKLLECGRVFNHLSSCNLPSLSLCHSLWMTQGFQGHQSTHSWDSANIMCGYAAIFYFPLLFETFSLTWRHTKTDVHTAEISNYDPVEWVVPCSCSIFMSCLFNFSSNIGTRTKIENLAQQGRNKVSICRSNYWGAQARFFPT